MEKFKIKYKTNGLSSNVLKLLLILMIAGFVVFVSFNGVSATDITINNTTVGGINGVIVDFTTNPGDTIYLEQGIYNKYKEDFNITIDKDNLSFVGNGPSDSVIIDAQHLSNIFTINDGITVNFRNITFINGLKGIILHNNTITFTNCNFYNNTASALYNYEGKTCFVNISNSNFIDNSAPYGGAIEAYHAEDSIYNIINSYFAKNHADVLGGAIAINGGTTIFNIDYSTFINNSADYAGGAIVVEKGSPTINVNNSFFTQNTAIYSGAIDVLSAYMSVYNTNFTYNNATFGGAISGERGTLPFQNTIIDNCIFEFNTASKNGGAIYDTLGFNITNSTFTSNYAAQGGGVYIDNRGASLETFIDNNTFINNSQEAIYNMTPYNEGKNFIYNLSNSTIEVDNYNPATDELITISGVLLDTTSGNPITGVNITINLNGADYTVTTNYYGIWVLPVDAPSTSGTYIITVSWDGSNDYIGFTNSTFITVS